MSSYLFLTRSVFEAIEYKIIALYSIRLVKTAWRTSISECGAHPFLIPTRAHRWMRRDSDDFNCVNSPTPARRNAAILFIAHPAPINERSEIRLMVLSSKTKSDGTRLRKYYDKEQKHFPHAGSNKCVYICLESLMNISSPVNMTQICDRILILGRKQVLITVKRRLNLVANS